MTTKKTPILLQPQKPQSFLEQDFYSNDSFSIDKIQDLQVVDEQDVYALQKSKLFFLNSIYSKYPVKANMVLGAIFQNKFLFLEEHLDGLDFNTPFLELKSDSQNLDTKEYSLNSHGLLLGNLLPSQLMQQIIKKIDFNEKQLIEVFSNTQKFSESYLLTLINYIHKSGHTDTLLKPNFLNTLLLYPNYIESPVNKNLLGVDLQKRKNILLKVISLLGNKINQPLNLKDFSCYDNHVNPVIYKGVTVGDFLLVNLLGQKASFVQSNNPLTYKQHVIPVLTHLLKSPYQISNVKLEKELSAVCAKQAGDVFLKYKKYLFEPLFIALLLTENHPYFSFVHKNFKNATFMSLRGFFNDTENNIPISFYRNITATHLGTILDMFNTNHFLCKNKHFWGHILKTAPSLILESKYHSGFKVYMQELLQHLLKTQSNMAPILKTFLEQIELNHIANPPVVGKKKFIL